MNRRILFAVIFALNLAAWLVIVELNGFLANFQIHLHLEVLLVIFPAFYFAPVPGLVLASGFGIFVGAARPPALDLSLLTFLGLWLAGAWMRRHLHRESILHLAGFAAGAQALMLLAYAILLAPPDELSFAIYTRRVLFDLLLSSGVAALLAAPWCRFQLRLLASAGWDLAHETARS